MTTRDELQYQAIPVDGARRPPLPVMRLSPVAQAGLVSLRVLLGLTAAMAIFSAFHGGPN